MIKGRIFTGVHKSGRHSKKENMHKCEICDKIFNQKSVLIRHKLSHSKEKSFSCDICSKSFSQAANLKTHRKLHFKDYRFSCDICNKQFSQKSNMLNHRNIHTGERPFPCDLCTESFVYNQAMQNHRKSHSNLSDYIELKSKPLDSYSCEICSKFFNTRGNFLRHKTKHLNEKVENSVLKLNSNIERKNKLITDFNSYIDVKRKVRVEVKKLNIEDIMKKWGSKVVDEDDNFKKKYFDDFNNGLIDEKNKRIKEYSTENLQVSDNDFKYSKLEITVQEKSTIVEKDICEEKDLSVFDMKPELDEHNNHEMFGNVEEVKENHIVTSEFLKLELKFDTDAVKEKAFDDKESEIDIDELLDGDDEDIFNSSNSEVPNILDEDLFHDLDTSIQEEVKHKFVKEIFITTQETEQPKDNLENGGASDKDLDCFDSTSENQPGLSGSQKFCPYCDLKFPTHCRLDQHIQTIHTNEKPYFCELCDKLFASKYNLICHNRNHSGKKLSCNRCKKTFTRKYTLIQHTRRHRGEKPYSCDHCGKSFATNSDIHMHMKRHRKKLEFKCSICGKCFKSSDSLTVHTRLHTSEKPYSCDTCGKEFTFNNDMHKHKRVCLNKKYVNKNNQDSHKGIDCSLCGKSFTRVHSYKQHMRIHTGENSYECDLCGEKFSSNSHMHFHKRTQHKNTPKIIKHTNIKASKERSNLYNREISFSCEICNDSFIDLGDCLKHEQTHIKSYNKRTFAIYETNDSITKIDSGKGVTAFKTEASTKIKLTKNQDIKMESNDSKEESNFLKTVETGCSPILEVVDSLKDIYKKRKQKVKEFTIKTSTGKKEKSTTKISNGEDVHSYSCKICNEIFDEYHALLKHQLSHLEGNQINNNFISGNNTVTDVDSLLSNSNELVYKCPMDSCGTKMGVYDLKNGRAVQHMIESHQIYPYKMVKLGLGWIKTTQ